MKRHGSLWIVVSNFDHGEKPSVREAVEAFVRIAVISRVCSSSSADGFEEIHCVVVHGACVMTSEDPIVARAQSTGENSKKLSQLPSSKPDRLGSRRVWVRFF